MICPGEGSGMFGNNSKVVHEKRKNDRFVTGKSRGCHRRNGMLSPDRMTKGGRIWKS